MHDYVLKEVEVMLKYALSRGMKVSPEWVLTMEKNSSKKEFSDEEIIQLVNVHSQLSALIAPAKPHTVQILCHESRKSKFMSMLGPIRIIRQFVFIALISLVVLISVGLFSQVNEDSMKADIFSSYGIELLLNMLFLLSAASLGAAFSALYKANDYVTEGTFDLAYSSTYWTRYILGLVSGIILAELLPEVIAGSESELMGSYGVMKPLFAILGGFSATAVYRILNVLVESVESLFKSKSRGMLKEYKKLTDQKIKETASIAQLKYKGKLMGLKQQLQKNGITVLDEEIEKMLKEADTNDV